jgi:hypothetical protein
MMLRLSLSLVALLLVGCAGAVNTPGAIPARQSGSVDLADQAASPVGALEPRQLMAVSPAACDHGKQVLFHAAGGVFRMPPCAGWSGHVGYPYVGIRSHWLVTTSLTDNFGAPTPPSGTAIFYMSAQLKVPKAELILEGNGASVTVAAPMLTADHTYTLIVYNMLSYSKCQSNPCPPLVVNLGSPQKGHHSLTFPSPFNDSAVASSGPQFSPVWQFIRN